MRAVVCEAFGPVDDLRVVEQDDLNPGPGEVRIDVEASGVNFVDALFVLGQYQIKPPTPFVPGSEVAGVIGAVGDGDDGSAAPRVGDRVLATCGLGGFADQVVVSTTAAIPIPQRLDSARAATFTQSYCTALFSLRHRGRLTAGETVLVLGAGGGVGLASIQVATALGARVLAVASSPDKRLLAEQAGAEASVDPATTDVKQAAREWSGGGVDVVVDPIGGELAEPALRALGEDGRFLVIGFASGSIPTLPANQILLRNRAVIGVEWGGWLGRHPEVQRQLIDELLTMVAAGELDPVAPTMYRLDEAARALADVLGRRVAGKLALTPT